MIKFTNKFQEDGLMYYFTESDHLLRADSKDALMMMATVVVDIESNIIVKSRYSLQEIMDSLVLVPVNKQMLSEDAYDRNSSNEIIYRSVDKVDSENYVGKNHE
jgi:hypothetical protein